MLYNIFKKTRKNKIKKTPLIIADVHEKNSLILSELKSSTQIRLKIKSLKIGDYLIGKTIVERKTISDFISAMINKRLIQQLKQMKKYKKQILILEGNLKKISEFKNPNAIRGFILSITTNYQIPVISSQDDKETSKYLITLAKQQLKTKTEPTFHSRIPKKIQEQKQYVLEAFPNIGPITAKKLLKKFKTISNTINASQRDLEEILKSRTKNFKKILES